MALFVLYVDSPQIPSSFLPLVTNPILLFPEQNKLATFCSLPCFLVDFPSSALAASLTVVIHFLCFFFLFRLRRARRQQEKYMVPVFLLRKYFSCFCADTTRPIQHKINEGAHQVVSLQLVVVAPPPLCSSSRVSGFDCPNAILVLWIKNGEWTSTSETAFQLFARPDSCSFKETIVPTAAIHQLLLGDVCRSVKVPLALILNSNVILR